MQDYIEQQAAIDAIKLMFKEHYPYDAVFRATRILHHIPTVDAVEVVRCKDCKHRPIDTQEEGNGFDYDFPEEYGCPGYCDDGYYSQRFNDDFYCAWGERADT